MAVLREFIKENGGTYKVKDTKQQLIDIAYDIIINGISTPTIPQSTVQNTFHQTRVPAVPQVSTLSLNIIKPTTPTLSLNVNN